MSSAASSRAMIQPCTPGDCTGIAVISGSARTRQLGFFIVITRSPKP